MNGLRNQLALYSLSIVCQIFRELYVYDSLELKLSSHYVLFGNDATQIRRVHEMRSMTYLQRK
jgi:hypothetical protein